MLECNWDTKVNISSFLGMEKIPERECDYSMPLHVDFP